jgi:hypothetical protein
MQCRWICCVSGWRQVHRIGDGRADKLNSTQGLFVTDDGAIYVADTDNGRIVELMTDEYLKRILGALL